MGLRKIDRRGIAIGGVSFNTKNEHDEVLRQFALKKGRTNFSGYIKRLIDMDRLGMIGPGSTGVRVITENITATSLDEETVELDPKLMKGLI